jgi:hypothetical protein
MASSELKPPLKGILKKPTTTTTPTPTAPTKPSSPRDPRTIALHHARLLQARKDTEAAIFDSTIHLLDLPLHASHPASSPHPDDIAAFTHHIRLFQPSDYDDLITERNLTHLPSSSTSTTTTKQSRCGYALCPNPRRRYPNAGRYKLVNKGRPDFDIVETAELERWCSTVCTRRALWVKVQLSETAAWERAGGDVVKIELYPEKKEDDGKAGQCKKTANDHGTTSDGDRLAVGLAGLQLEGAGDGVDLAKDMEKLRIEGEAKAARHEAALAVERGDDLGNEGTRSVEVAVREKKVMMPARAPSLGDEPAEGNTIEGYRPRFGGEKKAEDEDSGEDWV